MSVFGMETSDPIKVRAGKATITVGQTNLIALNVELTFQRQVEVVPTIGNKRVISIGEGVGTFSAQTILAKESNVFTAINAESDGCETFNMTISFSGAECESTSTSVEAHNCIASAVSIGMQGGRGYIITGAQVTFTALEIN